MLFMVVHVSKDVHLFAPFMRLSSLGKLHTATFGVDAAAQQNPAHLPCPKCLMLPSKMSVLS